MKPWVPAGGLWGPDLSPLPSVKVASFFSNSQGVSTGLVGNLEFSPDLAIMKPHPTSDGVVSEEAG